MDLKILRNPELQKAIRENYVSFPSQAPVFRNQPRADIQWRLAVLYFVRGWSVNEVARRYGLSRERAGQIITAWRILSVEAGYIQEIPPDPAANMRPVPARVELSSQPAAIAARGLSFP
jgi:hypothetical protein